MTSTAAEIDDPGERWVAEQIDRLSNWGRWGPDDEIGGWNHVTAAGIVRAARCVRKGRVFGLSLPFDQAGPQTGRVPGRLNPQMFMVSTGTDAAAGVSAIPGRAHYTDGTVLMSLSACTQWDGFPHVLYDGQMYNGVDASAISSAGAARNGVDKLHDRIVTRGVLLDVARSEGADHLEPGTAIDPDHLSRCCEEQGVDVEPGDAVLVRTGALTRARRSGGWDDYAAHAAAAGLSARCAEWLIDREVAAVATDTAECEVVPFDPSTTVGPLHQILLCHGGVTIGEMFDLDELAADCADDHVYDFLLVAPVLRLTGAVNSPVNPQAIK